MNYKTECSICRDYKIPNTNIWYTPKIDERRDHYFDKQKHSHGICPPCMIRSLVEEGLHMKEISKLVREVEGESNQLEMKLE